MANVATEWGVAIARAIANKPTVILADELTGNLDAKTADEVMSLLLNLNLSQGATIVLVTHDNKIADETERILIRDQGRVQKERTGNLARRKTEHHWNLKGLGLAAEIPADGFEKDQEG